MGLTSQLNRKYRSMIARGEYPVCYLCGQPIKRQSEVSQDHLLAKSVKNITIPENLVCVHRACNSKRGCMSVQQWFDKIIQRQRS